MLVSRRSVVGARRTLTAGVPLGTLGTPRRRDAGGGGPNTKEEAGHPRRPLPGVPPTHPSPATTTPRTTPKTTRTPPRTWRRDKSC